MVEVAASPSQVASNAGAWASLEALRRAGRLSVAVAQVEREVIGRELARARGNKSLTARRIGMTRAGLVMKMRRYGLAAPKESA
jgi:DNA-binding NtrC family response regulator